MIHSAFRCALIQLQIVEKALDLLTQLRSAGLVAGFSAVESIFSTFMIRPARKSQSFASLDLFHPVRFRPSRIMAFSSLKCILEPSLNPDTLDLGLFRHSPLSWRKKLCRNTLFLTCQHYQTLNLVLKFAHISWPWIIKNLLHSRLESCLSCIPFSLHAFSRKLSQSMGMSSLRSLSGGTTILITLYPVIQIFAEGAVLDHLLEIFICRGKHPDINLPGFSPPTGRKVPSEAHGVP